MAVFEHRFEGKTVLITGGTSGIGKATCLRAAAEGAFVLVVGRNRERGEGVVSAITSKGGKAKFFSADITSEAAVKALFAQIDAEAGPIDVAVNNAGVIGHGERVDELSTAEWDRILNTNLTGVFLCCREEAARMIAQGKGGSIVNVASVAGLTGLYRAAAYVASKHGVNGLTKAMANDLAPYHIRVNSINPANTTTPLTDAANAEISDKLGQAMSTGKSMEEAKADTMIGGKTQSLITRTSNPEEQAAAILHLASDDASFVTGTTVATDGGWTAY